MLFVTAANLRIDAHRREAVAMKAISRETALTASTAHSPDPEAQADTAAPLERLSAALAELPPQCRDAFLTSRLEKLTLAQIAARLGNSKKTVQRHIERALRVCVQVSDRRAVDEFFADKPELPIPMPDKSGSAVVVKQ